MSTNKVVLLRHGESEFNKLNLFCGWHDCSLSKKGLEDAKTIAVAGLRRHNMEFDCIYTSALHRAHQTVDVIVREMHYEHLEVKTDWRLNERHYGELTGYNKRQMANKYGEEKIQKWRRSFNLEPKPMEPGHYYYSQILNNPKFRNIPHEQFPFTESLRAVVLRTVPLWENNIVPRILKGERILVVTHGTVVRALMKHIEGISDADIMNLNIPNSVPCVYEYDMRTGKSVNGVKYLADDEYVATECAKIAAIGN